MDNSGDEKTNLPKIVLGKAKKPMTLIAALWESDHSFLIGADSSQIKTPSFVVSEYGEKIQLLENPPLAWGGAGNPTITADRFGQWVRDYDWQSKNWIHFQDDASKKLAELNGQWRLRSDIARVNSDPEELGRVLIVGFIKEIPCMFEIDDRGQPTVQKKEPVLYAIGSGGQHAILIHTAYKDIVGEAKSALELFGMALNLAVKTEQKCATPVHIYRVTKDGTEQIA